MNRAAAVCRCACRIGSRSQRSSDLEVIPSLVHVGGLIHQRVPAGNILDALEERAAIALGAGLFLWEAIRIIYGVGRRLAVVPEIPFRRGQECLGGGWDRAVIAVASDESALPTRKIPIEIFVGGIELLA